MLLRSKVRIPQPGHSVRRTRLLAQLRGDWGGNIISLVAPAGFGKTLLLAQWVYSEPDTPTAWLSLDESDACAGRFLSYLVYTLELAGVDMGPLASSGVVLDSGGEAEDLVYALVGQLEAAGSLNIVLDNYHRAESDQLNTVLLFLLHNLSPDIQLIIASRCATELPLAEFRLCGRIAEFNEGDLCFTLEETAQLFSDQLAPEVLLRLQQETGGWPAALQLMKLAFERTGDAIGGDLLALSEPDLADYLSQQIMSELDMEEQAFLLETAMLEGFTPPCADYVRGREDSIHLLRRLARLRPLLQMDNGNHSYHKLLRRYLLERLGGAQPQRFAALCSRAADWLVGEGQVNRALEVSSIAGDHRRAISIIQQAGGWYTLLRFGPDLLHTVLPHFSDKVISEFEELQVCRIFLLLKDGQLAEAERRIKDWCESSTTGKSGRSLETLQLALDMYSDAPVGEENVAQTADLIAKLPAVGAEEMHALLRTAQVWLLMGLGKVEEARGSVMESMQYLRQTELLYALNFFYYHLGFLQVLCCDIDHAQTSYNQGNELASAQFGSRYCLTSIGEVLLAQTYYLRNDLDGALALLERSLQQVSAGDGWCEIYMSAFTTATRLSFVRSGFEPALATLDNCEAVANERRLSRLAATASILRAEILTREGMLQNAERALREDLQGILPANWREERNFWYLQHLELTVQLRIAMSRQQWAQCRQLLDDSPEAGNRLHALERTLWSAGLLAAEGKHTEAMEMTMQVVDTLVHRKLPRIVLDIGPCLLPVFVSLLQQPSLREPHCHEFLELVVRDLGGDPEGASLEQPLSERESQVLQLLEQGLPNKLIARQLGTSENTIKFHLKNLFRKMGVTTRVAAIHAARELGLLH